MQKECKAMIKTKNIRNINSKYIFFSIIILGAIFSILQCFHINLWFDESYSIAIANHPFNELWTIGSHDVHPVLYYIIIKLILTITNGSIICVRIFSAVPLIIMGILGYTHIRKDFGEKAGMLFTLFSLFFPPCIVYASEIRMYTWAMLFATIMVIYAYRIFKGSGKINKDWIIFSIFSLACAYTHYYALAIAFVINIALFIYFLRKSIKNRSKNGGFYVENLKRGIISAVLQIIGYMPWLVVLMGQVSSTDSFWIGVPDFLDILEFQFTGNLGDLLHIPAFLSWPFTIIFVIYIIYMLKKYWKKEEIKPAKMLLSLYGAVVAFIGIISIVKLPILFARYFLTMTGMLILMIVILLSVDTNIRRVIAICTLTVIMSLVANINVINDNYDQSNSKPMEFLTSDLQEEDIFVTDNVGSGFVLVTEKQIPYDRVYFWDRSHWNVQEAYKAYGKTIWDINDLKDYKGRIWVIGSGNFGLAEAVNTELEDTTILKQEYFKTKYKSYEYAMTLIEKN